MNGSGSGERIRSWLLQGALLGIFVLAIGYLGRVGWALLPTPTPTPTWTPTPEARLFDGSRAFRHVEAQVAFGPRLPGSEAAGRTRLYIRDVLEQAGWRVEQEAFTFRGVRLVNLVARRGEGPVILLGAHYDTRRFAERDPDPARRREPVPGANDGASGVAVLLELARVLRWDTSRYAVWLYFFDAEDQGNIDGWPWSVGARYAARQVSPDTDIRAVIVPDMIGDADQQIYWERRSTPWLKASLWEVAARLGYGQTFIPQDKYTIIDDHLPFLEQGFPAALIIDFEYAAWHTTADTPDKVRPESLARVGRVIEAWVEGFEP